MDCFYIFAVLLSWHIAIAWASELQQSVIFDCTLVVNNLIYNRTTAAEQILFTQMLRESSVIYYESDSTITEMFETRFPIIIKELEDLGWTLGAPREFGNNTLLLSFGIKENVDDISETMYFMQDGTEFFYTTSTYKKPKTSFTDPNHAVHVILSWRRLNECNFEEPFKGVPIYRGLENLIFNSSIVNRYNSIEYTETQIGCETVNIPQILKHNFVVLVFDFVAGKRFPESYGMFREYLDSVTETNARYTRLYNQTQTLIRILLHPPATGTDDKSLKTKIWETYARICARFASRWAAERGQSVIIPLSQTTFHSYKAQVDYIFPIPLETVVPIFDPEIACSDDVNSLWQLPSLIASKFRTFYVDSLKFWENCQIEGSLKTTTKSHIGGSQNFSIGAIIEWDMSPLSYPDFEKSTQLLKLVFNQQVQAVVLHNFDTYDVPFIPTLNGPETPILNGYNNISQSVVCRYVLQQLSRVPVDAVKLADDVSSACSYKNSSLFNVVQLSIPNQLDAAYTSTPEDIFGHSFYISRVQSHLASVYELALQLKLKHHPPFKNLYVELPLQLSVHVDSNPELEFGLYCSEKILKYNQLIEAIMTWSHIHNITIILQNILSLGATKKGWWELVETYGFGDLKYSSVFLMRNYPESMSYLGTSPCLTKYEEVHREPIPMGTGMGCRISLEVYGRAEHLNAAELETQLQFALHKYKSVLIHCGECTTTMLKMLVSSLHKNLETRNQTEIFIDISVENTRGGSSLQSRLLSLAGQLNAVSSTGMRETLRIQISDWEQFTAEAQVESIAKSFIDACNKLTVEIGLVIRDCVRVLQNEDEFANNKLYRLGFSHFLCVESFNGHTETKLDSTSYYKDMTKFLDALYATKIILTRLFLGVKMQFRFDILTSNSEEYLRTVRDLSQHAQLYSMEYFAINGFSVGQASSAIPGWWRTSVTSDLANASNYAELESDYLGIPTWRPPQKLDQKFKLWMILVPLAILTIVFGIALFAVWRISKSRYLTAAEEQEFLEGTSDGTDDDYLHMGFDRKFEISKIPLDLETDVILGSGNFGTVYQALFNGMFVAVKVPQEGGCKEAFKSTLQEIKILCYVGTHENVLGFVGAYIKEIRKGIVQIATEFCENGTLLSYLHGLARTIGGIRGETDETIQNVIDSYNLERFCLEIAAGMEYLKEKKIIHGDLATRNVLLNKSFTCKIADFGLSRKLYEYEKYIKQSQEPLPWRWLAYESIVRMEFSSMSDVWSYGVTLWEIYSLGEVPYPGLSWTPHFADDLKNGLRCEKPRFATDELYGRMMDCWNLQGELRPSFTELREFFRSIKTIEYTTMDGDGYLSVIEIKLIRPKS